MAESSSLTSISPAAQRQMRISLRLGGWAFIFAGLTILLGLSHHEWIATGISLTFYVPAVLFYLWARRRLLPREVTARDLAAGLPHRNYPHGIDMSDIVRELQKPPPNSPDSHAH